LDDETPSASQLVKPGETHWRMRRAPKDIADAFPVRRVGGASFGWSQAKAA